jgi:hypothetical protein
MQGSSEAIQTLPDRPLISCLCVTEGRAAFLPWLVWNYDKQDHDPRELVVVDSSPEPPALPERPDVRVLRCAPGTTIGRKRNLAMEAARGAIVSWFDDDDWQHPAKLSTLAGALAAGTTLAGPMQSWFVDLRRARARPHESHRNVLFNGLGVDRGVLDGVRFDERQARAVDTAWVVAVRRRAQGRTVALPGVLFFWTCHRRNVSNPARRYVFSHPLSAVRDAVGAAAWGDTDAELDRLRDRVAAR